jgi:hypothetical protein
MTYPKLNGRPMDSLRKREFDALRKRFRVLIGQAADHKGVALDSELLTTAAWNCAFEVVARKWA